MEFKTFLKSKIYEKIILFFHENPTSVDTPRGIATWINQDLQKVRTALKKLAKSGILIDHKTTSTTAYSYTRNKRIISRIARLLKGEDR